MRMLAAIFATAFVMVVAGSASDAGSSTIDASCAQTSAGQPAAEYSSQRRRWRRNCFGNQGRCTGVWENGRKVIICCR